ncbi:MAG: NTP transferase domain-containing protein [Anaerolineales bacterium]
MKTVAILQARMSSSRLPGKVLLPLADQPMLTRVITRLQRASRLDSILVATTTDPADDPIAQFCAAHGFACYRGAPYDVLARYIGAAQAAEADTIVRITADCPLIDPDLVDAALAALHDPQNPLDFCANRLPPPWGRTYPIGLDVEVCTRAALERAAHEATAAHHREHVLPYLYDDLPPDSLPATAPIARAQTPRGFRIGLLHHPEDFGAVRWTVDTPADLQALNALYALLGSRADFADWREILSVWQANPELQRLNAAVQHKTLYDVDARAVKQARSQVDR